MMRARILGAAFVAAVGARPDAARRSQRAAARRRRRRAARRPIDLTGYWVAVVSEDWRHRMATPRKGDFESLPLNAEGRRVAERVGSRGRQRRRPAVQSVRRRRPHAPARAPAHHVGRRRHAARSISTPARRRGCSSSVRGAAAERRADLAGILARRVAAAAGRQRRARARADRQQHGPDRAGRRRPRSARRPAAVGLADRGRRAEGGHDAVPRRAICARTACRTARQATITEYFHRLPEHAERRRLAARADDRRGSALSERRVLHEHALQARGRTAASGTPPSAARAPPPPPAATRRPFQHVRGQAASAARPFRRLVRHPQSADRSRETQRMTGKSCSRIEVRRSARRSTGFSPTGAMPCCSCFRRSMPPARTARFVTSSPA